MVTGHPRLKTMKALRPTWFYTGMRGLKAYWEDEAMKAKKAMKS